MVTPQVIYSLMSQIIYSMGGHGNIIKYLFSILQQIKNLQLKISNNIVNNLPVGCVLCFNGL